MGNYRDWLCDFISTDCACLFLSSFFCTTRFFSDSPIAILMILGLRNRLGRIFFYCITYWAVDWLASLLSTVCFLVNSIFCVPGMGNYRDWLCDFISTDCACLFLSPFCCTSCFFCDSPIAIFMIFHWNCMYCRFINCIAECAVVWLWTFLSTGCFLIHSKLFFPIV